ncbi:MAG: helix-turn-helix domain-containing protein, partial [bacterium]
VTCSNCSKKEGLILDYGFIDDIYDYENLGGKKQTFIDWILTPESERKIKTQRELAKKIGVEEHTISRWKKDKHIVRAIKERKKHIAGVFNLVELMDYIYDRATNESDEKSYQFARLWLNWWHK